MPSIAFRDGLNNIRYASVASGSGTEGDPFVWQHSSPDQSTKLSKLIDLSSSSTATRSSIAAAATDTLLLATNPSRKRGSCIYNDSSATLFLALGTTASSSTNFTVKLFQDDFFEIPQGYTGEVRGVWATATGNARITEVV